MTKKQKKHEDILRRHDAWEPNSDKHDYQWQLRLLQSLWREKQVYPARVETKVRGAELEVRHAEATLSNYLTETIRKVVCEEVHDPERHKDKSYKRPRIHNHLLSSQPLCFNLFGELTRDFNLASQVLGDMSKGRVGQVTAIEFEWSPGRGDDRYLGDKTAFDIYVIYQNADRRGFLGIEVKYHEILKADDNYKNHKDRYDKVAAEMGCFREEHLDKKLRGPKPLEQMWRNHLLVGAHCEKDGFDDACFVFLYPEVNDVCSGAAEDYRRCLSDTRTFEAWTLDDFVRCLRKHTDAEWVQMFYDRYLDLSRLPLRGVKMT